MINKSETINKRNSKSDLPILVSLTSFLLVLLVLLSFSSVLVNAFSTSKTDYYLGESILINLQPDELVGTELKITTTEGSFKFLGELDENISFNPTISGNHIISLYKNTGDYEELLINVSEPVVDCIFSTNKQTYSLGEDVAISLTNCEAEELIIFFANNSSTSVKNTNPSNFELFTPSQIGDYTVKVVLINQSILEKAFSVVNEILISENDQILLDGLSSNNLNNDSNNNLTTTDLLNSSQTEVLEPISQEKIQREQARQKEEDLLIQDSIKNSLISVSSKGKTYLQLTSQGVNQVSENDLRLKAGLSQPDYLVRRIKSAQIENVFGAKENFKLNILNRGSDLEINWSNAVQPGIYKVIFTKEDGTIEESYLAVGLISVNSVKPIYKVGEQADLLMVVLDKYGYLVTDANIDLEIITPDNKKIQKSTVDNSIVETTKRGVYETTFNPAIEGTYYLIASTIVDGVNVNVTSSFLVNNNYAFDILRAVPATIDPWEGPYKNEFTIIPSSELMNTTYSFSEIIPSSFGLVNYYGVDNVFTSNSITTLTWNNLSSISKISYEAQVPFISPYLYELGKAKITYVDDLGLDKTFYEARPWLFAIDPAAVTCTESPCVASSSLIQCTGASGEPNAPNTIDTCTDGTSGTCHSDESVENITVTNLDARVGDNSFRIGDTIEIEVWYYCWGATNDYTQIAYYNGTAWVNLFNSQCGTTGYTSKTAQVILDDYIGTQSVRGIMSYNSASATTCAGGNYDDNDDVSFVVKTDDDQGPVITNTQVNDTALAINESVRITSNINDLASNVSDVLAVVLYPNGTKNNFSMLTTTISNVFNNDFNTTTNSILGQSGIPATTVYNYQGVTTSSVENAWFNDVDQFLYGGSTTNRNTHVEFTNTQYTAIASSDDSRATSVDPGRNDEIVADFQFFIQEPIANINTIQFTTESSTTVSTTYNRGLYVLQAGGAYQTDSNWLSLGSCSGAGNIDVTCSKNLTSSFSTYIDGTTGQLDWSAQLPVSTEINYYDYAEAKVFYTTPTDNEADKSWITQEQITTEALTNINYVNITITIDSYSNSGSSSRSNNNPDIQLQLYDGSSWLDLGNFSINGAGDYTLSTTNSALLTAWEDANNRDVRVRGVAYDYVSSIVYDNITYSNLKVSLNADKEIYYYDFTDTQNSGLYNVTKVWANDSWGNINYQNYSAVYFNVYNYGVPKIIINDISGDISETYAFQDQTPDINATIDTNATCYLSLLDEGYDDMVANNRINCGSYEQNIPKICTYSSTLNIGSQTIYMACLNTLPGAPSTSKHTSSNNSESAIDVLCDTHSDCTNNQFCDYTYHCHADIVDGFDCKQVSYNGLPADDVCGSYERGGADYGTCINDSSYLFTGWYCAYDQNDCVYNNSGHTYDYNYALCDLSIEGYRICGYSQSQEWGSLVECGAQFDGTNNSANASTHSGENCSYFSSAPSCLAGDLDLGAYGCNATVTDCGSYIYLGSGLCGSTLADCDQGCGAECDVDTNITAGIIPGLIPGVDPNICYYDKSCAVICSYSESTEEAPDFCINDNDGGPCNYNNRTNPSSQESCYWNPGCADGIGASLDNSGSLRNNYCDYCSVSGNVSGDYSPIPNSTCLTNCSNLGIIYYDPQATPADRSDDCNGLGGTNLLTDTLAMGDVWTGSGQAYCDNTECDLDCGTYLDGACFGGATGTCVCTDNNNPEITPYNPADNYWFNSVPAIFEFEVYDAGSGIQNCSLIHNGAIVSTNNSIIENLTTLFSYSPSLGSFTWQVECYDDSSNRNYNVSDSRNSGYDNSQPVIVSANINQSSFEINNKICIYASITDTYSGMNRVYAQVDLPDSYGTINLTLTDEATSCDSGTGNNVYSIEYELIFSGDFNLTDVYAYDKANNLGSYAVLGKNWTVAAAGIMDVYMYSPLVDLLLNESSSPSANYVYYQNCTTLCTDRGIPCEGVRLYVEYDNSSIDPNYNSENFRVTNTTDDYLYTDVDDYFCGNLTLAPAPWWNASWGLRQEIKINHTYNDVTEYQLMIYLDTASLISAGKLRSDCADLRFTDSRGNLITYYLEESPGLTCNQANTLVWVQVPSLKQNADNRIYLYYNNSAATSLSDLQGVFTYGEEKDLYYAIGDFTTRGNLDVISYIDNNSITLSGNGESTTLDRGGIYTNYDAADINAGDYWSAKGPIAFASSNTNSEGPVPISFAGNEFISFIDRGGTNKEWFVYAPFGDGTVNFYAAASGSGSMGTPIKTLSVTRGTRYYVTDADGTDDYIFLINSTTPILLAFEQGNSDTIIFHPSDKDYWGISEDVGFAYLGTSRTLCESDAACSSTIRNGPYAERLGGSSDGRSVASHIYADKNIGYLMTADGDGSEAYFGWPEYEFSREYLIPVNWQYITAAVSEGSINSCNWYNITTDTNIAYTPSGSNSYPAPRKLYIGDGTNAPVDNYGGAGDIISCNDPMFLAIEPNNDDEANILSYKQARQYVYPEPTWSFESEIAESDLDFTNSSCSYLFTVTTGLESGNNTLPIRCKADGENSATSFSEKIVNITVNDHPISTIGYPINNSWVSGTFAVDGSSSTDGDGTINNYLFRYDDNSAFSSPTTACNGASSTCSFDSLTQNQCVNNSISCYLGLQVTDNNGLTNNDYVVIGIDTNGPVSSLDKPTSFANYSTSLGIILDSLIFVNASIFDNEVGIIDEAFFEYRFNSTDSWKSACNDTGINIFECNWNISSLNDGKYYEFRVYANDSFGNLGLADTHTNITIDRNGPIVLLQDPANNTYGIENFTITYNVSDALLGTGSNAIVNCSIYVGGALKKTNSSIIQSQNSFDISITSGEGNHSYYIECYDKLGNLGISKTKNLIIDETGPTTTILQPLTNSQISGSSYMMNASVIDTGIGTISYVQFEYRQNPEDVWKNACNDSDGTAPFNCTWNISLLADGNTYQVRARANDTLGNTGLYDTEVNIKIDNNGPQITLLAPRDNYVDGDGNVTFVYQVNDLASSISNCSLIYNGTINQTVYSPQENTDLNFNLAGLNDSVVDWAIECYDTFNPSYYSISSNRTLTIDIKFILDVKTNTSKSDYEYGDEVGEDVEININVTDIFNVSLQSNVITDIISSNITPSRTWWNTSWSRRKELTVYEPGVYDRENWPVEATIILTDTTNCNNELRVTDDSENLVNFTITNTVYGGGKCTQATIVFLADVLKSNSSDYYVYYSNAGASSVAVTPATYCTDQTPACWTTYYSRINLAHMIEPWQTGSTNFANNNDDDQSYTRTLPWAFPLFGRTPSTTMYVWTNGFLSPTISGTSGWYQNLLTGGSSLSTTPMIAPLWDDLYVNNNAGIWETINNSGAVSKVIYTFNLTTYAQRTSSLKDFFQVVLYETGDVMFNYGLFTVGGETPTTGISDGTTSNYLSNDDTWGSNAESIFYQRKGTNVTINQEETWITRFSDSTDAYGLKTFNWNIFNQPIGLYYSATKAYKTKYEDNYNITSFNISYDSKAPIVSLVTPDNNTEANSSVTFAYQVNDVLSSIANCTLFVDGVPGEVDTTIQEGLSQFFYPRIPGVGPHNWSVGCYDAYGNLGMSDEWIIIIIPPELETNQGNLSITPGPYMEGMNLTINLTIWNNGGSDTVNNFTINVYDGPVENAQIVTNVSINLTDQYGDHQNETISFNYVLIRPGKTQIYVEIDAPVSLNGTIFELNESNNIFIINISVPAYSDFFGNVTSNIILSSSDNKTFFNVTGVVETTGLLYFADAENDIHFNSLQSLGKKIDNSSSTNDFVEIDQVMNMSDYDDSVNIVWTLGTGNPANTSNMVVRGYLLYEVPVVNSDLDGDFKTGILWDTSDDVSVNLEYDSLDKEEVLFVTNINESLSGDFGVYDYQAKIPAQLRNYGGSGGDKVALYYELN